MRKNIITSFLALFILLFSVSLTNAQNYNSADECIQTLASRCMSLMDPQAKRTCFQGNKVYCAKFDKKVIINPEDIPFSDRLPKGVHDKEAVTPRPIP
jgi:hypothetical protein